MIRRNGLRGSAIIEMVCKIGRYCNRKNGAVDIELSGQCILHELSGSCCDEVQLYIKLVMEDYGEAVYAAAKVCD